MGVKTVVAIEDQVKDCLKSVKVRRTHSKVTAILTVKLGALDVYLLLSLKCCIIVYGHCEVCALTI